MLAFVVTRHAVQRSRQRLSWSRATLERMVDRVFYAGLGRDDCGGELARYLAALPHDASTHCVRIYGEQVFVFARHDDSAALALLTVYGLPSALRVYARRARQPRRQHLALAA